MTGYFNYMKIHNLRIREIYHEFVGDKRPTLAMRELGYQIIDFDISDFNLDFFLYKTEKPTCLAERLKFMVFLYDKGIYKENENELLINRKNLLSFGSHSFRHIKLNRYSNLSPLSFVSIKNRLSNNVISVLPIIISNSNRFNHKLISDYIKYTNMNLEYNAVVVLESIINNRNIEKICDFNDDTFYKDYLTIRGISCNENGQSRFKELIRFYLYIHYLISKNNNKQNINQFSKYSVGILNYRDLYRKLNEGHVVVNLDEYKYDRSLILPDKIIFEYKTMFDINEAGKAHCFDFSIINDSKQKDNIKKYYIEDSNLSITNKNKKFYVLIDFVNYMHMKNRKYYEELFNSLYMYKNYLNNKHDYLLSTIYDRFKTIQYFLAFVNENIEGIDYKDEYFIDLIHYKNDVGSDKREYSKEDIEKLKNAYYKNYHNNENDILALICYTILRMVLEDEMRESEIFRIQIDSFSGNSINVRSKTSGYDKKNYALTSITVKLLNKVIEKTRDLRKYADLSTKNYIFIYSSIKRKHVVRTVTSSVIMNYHKKICRENKIKYLPFKTFRNYFNQKVTNYVDKNNLPNSLIQQITSHNIKDHEKHYVKHDLEEIGKRIFYDDLINKDIQCDEKYNFSNFKIKEMSKCFIFLENDDKKLFQKLNKRIKEIN